MRKLSVSTLVSLDGVFQDPGGFGETARGGWANPYFTAEAQRDALEHMLAAGYFLIGRVTYELLRASWENVEGSAYLDRVNDLVDEYRVAVHPVVLGGGTPLFPPDGVSATLRLTGTRTLDSGVVSLSYVPADRA